MTSNPQTPTPGSPTPGEKDFVFATKNSTDGNFSSSSSSVLSTHDVVNASTEKASAAQANENNNSLSRHATARSQHPAESLRPTPTREDGSEYPTGTKLALISVALCLSVFLMALDNSIISTAIPKITDEFQSLADVGWYGSAYLLTTSALQLLFGKFYTFWSIKWVFLCAITVFEIGSLICGVAPSSVVLIVGRAIAGLGSAGIMSGALLILAHSVPLAKRPMYTGMIGSMYGIASVAGPLLGGVFTDKVSWRWCFYINLPIGGVTLAVIALFFNPPATASLAPSASEHAAEKQTLLQKINRFDPLGNLVFMPAVICLLLALQWGGVTYAWSSARIVALFVVFGVLILSFVYIQYRNGDKATVPLRIVRNRTVWSSAAFAFCMGAGFFIAVYYVPMWFQTVQGVSAVESGIRNLPMMISTVIFSLVAGGTVTALGYYAPFMLLSTLFASVGAGLLSTFHPGISSGKWIGFQILYGAGVGMGLQQPLMAVQTVLDIRDVPTGTAFVVFLQTLGGALFVSVGQTVFTNALVRELLVNAPGLDVETVLTSGATNLRNVVDPSYMAGVALSYSEALTTAFLVGAGLSAATVIGSAFVEWKSVKGKKVEVGMA